jgi:20S proteasome alpha/beta subunit
VSVWAGLIHSFLGYVDLQGTTYDAPTLATGYGAHIAQPLLREAFEAKAGTDGKGPLLTAEEAEKVIADCMKVLFYRDARSINKVSNDHRDSPATQTCTYTYSSKSLRLQQTESRSRTRRA